MKNNKFQIVKLVSTSLTISIIALAGAIGLHMAIAAWQGPTADPPSSNVSAPVNVGTTTQVKTGELELQGGLKIHNSGQPTAKLYTDTSGLYIDAQNDGDSNLISTESYLYLRGKILDIADDTVNIGEKLSVDGDLEFSGASTRKIIFNSDVNYGSDLAFLYFNENSSFHRSGTENVRFSIGTYNDFSNSTSHSDSLDIQGGARLVLNAGDWDAELDSAVGSPTTGSDLDSNPIRFRVNNSDQMVIGSDGSVGIGIIGPSYKLDIGGQVHATGDICTDQGGGICLSSVGGGGENLATTLGIGNSAGANNINMNDNNITNLEDLYVNNLYDKGTGSQIEVQDNMDFNNNTVSGTDWSISYSDPDSKLTIDLIDPVYDIKGEKFATYMAAMTGVKEETTGNVNLSCNKEKCFKIIDFTKQKKGNDLWLFYQITDLGKDWSNLVVLLTPEGQNVLWYETKPEKKQLIIYGEKEGKASYRITAPRFDYKKWSNISEEDVRGIQINPK